MPEPRQPGGHQACDGDLALLAGDDRGQAAQIAGDMLAKPLPPVAEARLRCALSSVLCARGQARDAAAEAGMVLAGPQLPDDLRDQAMTAQLQALTGLRDGLAGPIADTILAAPGQCDSHAAVAALVARAVVSWDNGQIGEGLALLRDAARHGTGISPDARHVQPLLALAAALVDLRQLDDAEDLLQAADDQALHAIPAEAALSVLRARIHLAKGQLSDAAAAGQAALATAETLGAHGYASTAHCVLGVIALRRGDIAAAAHHIASRPAPMPHFPGLYARTQTTVAEAQITEARDGLAAPSATSARFALISPRTAGSSSENPSPQPGWCAPHWLRATMGWPRAPPAQRGPSPATIPDTPPSPPPRLTAWAWPPGTRPASLRLPRNTPTRGPWPPQQKTSVDEFGGPDPDAPGRMSWAAPTRKTGTICCARPKRPSGALACTDQIRSRACSGPTTISAIVPGVRTAAAIVRAPLASIHRPGLDGGWTESAAG